MSTLNTVVATIAGMGIVTGILVGSWPIIIFCLVLTAVAWWQSYRFDSWVLSPENERNRRNRKDDNVPPRGDLCLS